MSDDPNFDDIHLENIKSNLENNTVTVPSWQSDTSMMNEPISRLEVELMYAAKLRRAAGSMRSQHMSCVTLFALT